MNQQHRPNAISSHQTGSSTRESSSSVARPEAAPVNSPSEIKALNEKLDGATRILSDDKERFSMPVELQDNLIILDNGVLLFTEAARVSENFLSVVKLIERSKETEITQKVRVSDSQLNYVRTRFTEEQKDDDQISSMEAVESERFFYNMIKIAADHRSSDIHYTVYGSSVQAKVNTNGRKRPMDVKRLSPKRAKEFMSAAYGMTDSKGDFNPNRHQEGNVRIEKFKDANLRKLLSNYVSVRLNFLPVVGHGIHMVVRLNGRHESIRSFKEIGFNEEQNEALMRVSSSPGGFFIIGGPVNSGKSKTLASVTQIRGDKNTDSNGFRETSQLSLEDPPELFVEGLLPLDIMASDDGEDASDKKLHETMRGLNRSDYDDGILGEIRDGVIAQRVLEVAMAGRFAGTTVHAPNAMMVFTRVEQLLHRIRGSQGSFDDLYEKANCAGVMSQRLLGRLCPSCSVPLAKKSDDEASMKLMNRLAKFIDIAHPKVNVRVRGEGCDNCRDGHTGRELVAEIIRPDQTFLDLLKEKKTAAAREYWVESLNGQPMVTQAVIKMREGLVDPNDVERTFGYFDEISVAVPPLSNDGDDSFEEGI